MPSSAELLALHVRLWGPTEGDSEDVVVETERRLGLTLPPVLRTFYRDVELRESEMLHLLPLDELRCEQKVLVFGAEQQRTFEWGVRLDRLADADPPLVIVPSGEDDGITLSAWLATFSTINRAYLPPCAPDCVPDDAMPGWERFEVRSNVACITLYTRGRAASDGLCVGAATRAELIAALQSLGLEEDEVEIFE